MTKVNDIYYDANLLGNLEILKKNIKEDWDFWFVIDGMEGSGKSTLAQQTGYFLDPTLSVKNIVFTPKQFEESVDDANKYQVIIWDEAITGTQSVDMSKMARTLQRKAVQMRQKNLFIILVLHSYYELKKYYAIHRTWFLLHTYYTPNMESERFERGYFAYYGRDKKRIMYCTDKMRRNYEYGNQPEFRGRFTKKYTVDEAEYKKKKAMIDEGDGDGITDKEFVEAAFKRGLPVGMIQPYVSISERHLYRIKESLTA